MKKERIPFDWELLQSGQYEAVYRSGEKPLSIWKKKHEITNFPIITEMMDADVLHCHKINGKCYETTEWPRDLFLIPIPKKIEGWVVFNEGAPYATIFKTSAQAKNAAKGCSNPSIVWVSFEEGEGID